MKNRRLLALCTALVALVLLLSASLAAASPEGGLLLARSKKKATPTPAVTQTLSPEAPTPSPVPEGPITDPQSITDYLFANGCLPENFLTKAEARRLGWDSSYNYVGDVAHGMSIGGDRFGNYEGLLPTAKGRQYYEADCYYEGRKRNACRIIYAELDGAFEGLVFYTDDHYQTFTQMYPFIQQETEP